VKREKLVEALMVLRKATKNLPEPMSVVIAREYCKNPFLLLVSCLLSLRAKDTKTLPVSRELFSVARTPEEFVEMPLAQLERLIYSIGFYKRKARVIKSVSEDLIRRFGGVVPRTRQELLSINGVGPKTASLVLGMAYDIPSICVDVHVHRLANRLGFVKTKTPIQTEKELENLLPIQYWTETNHLLTQLGQNLGEIVPRLPISMQSALSPLLPKSAKL